MQFGAERCVQRARQGCTWHDGRAKPAWAMRTGPVGVPHASNQHLCVCLSWFKESGGLHSDRRSQVPTNKHETWTLQNGRLLIVNHLDQLTNLPFPCQHPVHSILQKPYSCTHSSITFIIFHPKYIVQCTKGYAMRLSR